ncbi:MAG: hypothetical protein Q9201_003289 [Fulgogasparrea decipioides]
MDLVTILAIPILISTLWLFTASLSRTGHPHFINKKICLLIAHPDDEAMFFAPTLLALLNPKSGNHLKILCLSNGNFHGFGKVREKELMASAEILGLRNRNDVLVLDTPDFVDGKNEKWDAEKIADILRQTFNPQRPRNNENEDAPTATIDVLVTFDHDGISGHPNHIALYYGAKAWLGGLMKGKRGWRCPVELHTLTSVSIYRKYIGFLDAPMTMLLGFLGGMKASGKHNSQVEGRRQALFISDIGQWRQAQKAMTRAHKSQMIWFRWGWITFGRHMVVNDLKREHIG